MKLRGFSVFVLAGLLTWAGGCSHPVGVLGIPSSSYHKELERETRKASYYGLESVEYLTYVTYRSPNLRRAYVDEYGIRFHLPAEKKEEMLKHEMEEAENYDVFIVSHFSTNSKTSKLTKDTQAWRLELTGADSSQPEEPESVDMTHNSRDPVFSYFYPYVTPWSSNFVVKFKKLPETARLVFRMAGVSGDVTYDWAK